MRQTEIDSVQDLANTNGEDMSQNVSVIEIMLREIHTQTNRQTDGRTDMHTDRQIERHTDRQTYRQTQRDTEIQTHIETDVLINTQREGEIVLKFF